MKKALMSLFLVIVMCITMVNVPQKVKAEGFLSDEMAQKFVSLFYDVSDTMAQNVKEVLTGERIGTYKEIESIVENVVLVYDVVNQTELVEEITSKTVADNANKFGNVLMLVKGVMDIYDNGKSFAGSDNLMQKAIDGFQIGMSALEIFGAKSYLPPQLSLALTAIEIGLEVGGVLEVSYFAEGLELYKANLAIEYYAGQELTYKEAPYVFVGSLITQDKADAQYAAAYMEYKMKRIMDNLPNTGYGYDDEIKLNVELPDVIIPIENFEYTKKDDGIIINKYNGRYSTGSIPNKIEGLPVIELAEGAFKDSKTIRELTVPASVKKIGSETFRNCINLEKLIVLSRDISIDVEALKIDIEFIDSTTQYTGKINLDAVIYGYDNTPSHSYAEENGYSYVSIDWDGTTLKQARYSDEQYYVTRASELAWIAHMVNNEKMDFSDITINFENDIYMNNQKWTPIGNGSNIPFKGNIDGNDNGIYELYVENVAYGGFIGYYVPSNSFIQNIDIVDAIIVSNSNSIAILISNIMAYSDTELTIKNCKLTGTVTADGYPPAAALCGTLINKNNAKVNICDINTKVAVKTNNAWGDGKVGGLFAKIENEGAYININNCILDNNLYSQHYYGYRSAIVGGIIGSISKGTLNINKVAVTDTLYSRSYTVRCGGFIGTITPDVLNITNSYVNASISSVCTNGDSGAGGFIGASSDATSDAHITNCYMSGSVSASYSASMIAFSTYNTIHLNNCYFDTTTTGIPAENKVFRTGSLFSKLSWLTTNNTTSEGLSKDEMKEVSNYKDWDFFDTWVMGEEYPVFQDAYNKQEINNSLNITSKDATIWYHSEIAEKILDIKISVFNKHKNIKNGTIKYNVYDSKGTLLDTAIDTFESYNYGSEETAGVTINGGFDIDKDMYVLVSIYDSDNNEVSIDDGRIEIVKKEYVSNSDLFIIDESTGIILEYTGEEEFVIVPETINGIVVKGIGDSAFNSNSNITNLVIDGEVKTIGSYAFDSCSRLENVTIGDSVTSIGSSAFSYCNSLTSIEIPDSVVSIGDSATFSGCSSLINVTIGNSVTSIGNNMFDLCSKLENVTIGNGVTSIGSYAFSSCNSIETVCYGGTKEEWNNITIELGNTYLTSANVGFKTTSGTFGSNLIWTLYDNATLLISGRGAMEDYSISSNAPWYSNRSSIKNVVIEGGVTRIGKYAFYKCSGLESITIGNKVTSIGTSAFYGCSALENIKIPKTVINISTCMFYNCSSLTSIEMPNSVIRIGDSAFYGCNALETVYYYGGTEEEWNNITIGSDNTYLTSVNIIFNIASGTCGSNLTWTLDGNGTLTIRGSGDMDDYSTSSNAPWYNNRSSIKNVVIEGGVTRIGKYAFYKCSGLESVTIGNKVASIGTSAFYGCSALENIKIPKSVTNISTCMFYNCSSLASIEIPDSVASIGNSAFYKCSSLETVDYVGMEEKWNSITIGTDNTYLTSANIIFKIVSGRCGDNITWMLDDVGVLTISGSGDMDDYSTSSNAPWYSNRGRIESVVIEGGIASIGNCAFYECSSLETVCYVGTEEKWNSITIGTDNTYLSSANIIFEYYGEETASGMCGDNLTWTLYDSGTLTISGSGDMENYTDSYSYAPWRSNQSSIKSVVIENGVTRIGRSAFQRCSNIIHVEISDSVTSMGACAFYGCVSLTSIKIPKSVTNISTYMFYNCSNLTSIKIPNSVTSIGNCAFEDCDSLTSIVIPDSVTSIGGKAFRYCSNLTDVYYDGSEVEWDNISIGSDNDNLTSANVIFNSFITVPTPTPTATPKPTAVPIPTPKPVPDSGTCGDNLTWALYDNGVFEITGSGAMVNYASADEVVWSEYTSDITEVIISDGVTSIGDCAFSNFTALESITLPRSVEKIGAYALYNCSNLKNVQLPSALKEIGMYAFAKCSSVTEITLPEGLETIGENAFRTCSNLESVKIPDTVTDMGTHIFYACRKLKDIRIPDGIGIIGKSMFYNCVELESITLPVSITSIGEFAFYNCMALKNIYYDGNRNTWENINISSENDCLTDARIYTSYIDAVNVNNDNVIITYKNIDSISECAIIASYNDDGSLMQVKKKDASDTVIFENITYKNSIKAFLWDNWGSMYPSMPSKEWER